MRFLKPLGALAAVLLIVCCFLVWARIPSQNLSVTGIDTSGTRFGKPGYLHLAFSGIFLLLLFIPRLWSRRINLFFVAFNVAWAFRNLFIIGACFAGECPEKTWAIYALPVCSILMLLTVLLAPEELPVRSSNDPDPALPAGGGPQP